MPALMVNPRYACYCVAQGKKDVDAMVCSDKIQWPGGAMTGYILWNKKRLSEFAQSLSDHDAQRCFCHGNLTEEGHKRYDAWMQAQYPGWELIR